MFPLARAFRHTLLALVGIGLCATLAFAEPPAGNTPQRFVRPRLVDAPTDLVVVAPHPDDEALLASGLLLRAKQAGQRVAVVIMTNGDFDCQVDGLVREQESVQGLAEVGVDEGEVYFLGYPDGYLARLGQQPLAPVPRRINGVCAPGNQTYGNNGHGQHDFHKTHFGEHAVYTAENAVHDLATLLSELDPARLVVTHPNDSHPDHAATYTLVRRALERLPQAPHVMRGLVHTDDCWPTGTDATGRCLPGHIAPNQGVPPLTGTLAGYVPDARIAVPQTCLTSDRQHNPKLRAIGAHRSQTHDDVASYLFSFARAEEVFFSESLAQDTQENYTLVHLAVPRTASETHIVLEPHVLEAHAGEYTLFVNRVTREVGVSRGGASIAAVGSHVLQRWPLAHDTLNYTPLSQGDVVFRLELERLHADGTAELAVYAGDVLMGVTVALNSRFAPKQADVLAFTPAKPAPRVAIERPASRLSPRGVTADAARRSKELTRRSR